MSRSVTITAAFQIDIANDVSMDNLQISLPNLLRSGIGVLMSETAPSPEILAIDDRLGLLNHPFDIRRVLDERREIAIVWAVEDVLVVRPDLSDQEAWSVLQHAKKYHDAGIGINWETLNASADVLFGPEAEGAVTS